MESNKLSKTALAAKAKWIALGKEAQTIQEMELAYMMMLQEHVRTLARLAEAPERRSRRRVT